MEMLWIAGLHNKAHASAGNAHHRHRNARHKALHIRNVVCARFAVEQVHNGGIGAAQIQIDKREIAPQIGPRAGKALARIAWAIMSPEMSPPEITKGSAAGAISGIAAA